MDVGAWAVEHAALFESLGPAEAAKRIELWRAAAATATGLDDVELAGPFQRHFTARGTGLPSNLCLVLTPAEVHAHKLDPRTSTFRSTSARTRSQSARRAGRAGRRRRS